MVAGQLYDSLRRYWINMPRLEKAKYAAQAGSSNHQVRGIKPEPTVETKFQDTPHMGEPPISAAELEEHKHTTFQLQTLLRDAGPNMLESSVEQGVRVLDQLKVLCLTKWSIVQMLSNGSNRLTY